MPQPLDRAVKHPMKICKKLEQQREPEHFLGMYLYLWKPLFKGVETDELELLTRRLKECCAGLRNIRTGVVPLPNGNKYVSIRVELPLQLKLVTYLYSCIRNLFLDDRFCMAKSIVDLLRWSSRYSPGHSSFNKIMCNTWGCIYMVLL
uniref:Uncharacterized protein n=1 Tax=Oryza barthii TaxID=65489 RepID=A0A0D3F4C9_9ORYZ